jgi:hypothetical protein
VTKLRAEMLEGVRWLWGQPFLRAGVLLVAGSNFAFSALILALIVRAKALGASSATVGIMLAFLGGGAIVGSLIAPWVQRRVHAKVIMIGSFWVWAVARSSAHSSTSPTRSARSGRRWDLRADLQRGVLDLPVRARARPPARARGQRGARRCVGAIPLGQLTAGILLERIGASTRSSWSRPPLAAVGLAASRLAHDSHGAARRRAAQLCVTSATPAPPGLRRGR